MDKCVFYDIPKTGCSWVAEGLTSYLDGEFIHGTSHQKPMKGHYPKHFSFTFIRHPVDWYRSYYASRVDRNLHMGLDLKGFVEWTYEKSPRLFEDKKWTTLTNYVKPFLSCDFVGRTENLEVDLLKALKLAGQGFDKGNLLDRPKVNVSKTSVAVDKATRVLIEKKEKYLIEMFYKK